MPPRSTIETLPNKAREIVESALLAANFSGYAELTEQIAEKFAAEGYEVRISASALKRFGSSLEQRFERLRERQRLAQMFVRDLPDNEGAVNDLSIQLMQDRLLELVTDEDLDDKALSRIAGALADLTRASVLAKKHIQSVRAAAAKVAAEVSQTVKQAGLSDEDAEVIRRKILGIATESP